MDMRLCTRKMKYEKAKLTMRDTQVFLGFLLLIY